MSIDEQIAQLEQDIKDFSEQAARHRGIADNSTRDATHCLERIMKLKAQRDAAASKTVGQRVADIEFDSTYCDDFRLGVSVDGISANKTRFCFVTPAAYAGGTKCDQGRMRSVLAQIIDKAVNAAVADEREACAQLLIQRFGYFADAPAVTAIRSRK